MAPRKILHVDDDEDMRTIVQIALSLSGDVHLEQCSNGEDAIKKAKVFSPDLLLLDVMMPGVSGEEIDARVRAIDGLQNVETIFITAKAEDEFIKSLIEKGALGVISKPFDPMTLSVEINSMWPPERL